jgi:hypothetical protein
MSSTISAARQALYSMLAAAAADNTSGLYGVQVAWGDPLAYEEQQIVCMRGVANSTETPADIGDYAHGERYQIELTVMYLDPAGDAQTVDTGANAIADAVGKVVSTKATPPAVGMLAGTVQWAFVASRPSPGAQPAQGGGWVCFVDLSVACAGMPLTI